MKNISNARKNAMKVGAGLIAAGAAAATGYYFYGSEHAKNHRKRASKWANDMKKEVLKEMGRLERASPKAFATAVDRIADTYQVARRVDAKEMKRAANELKANWEMIKKEIKRAGRQNNSRIKRTKRSIK